MLRDDLQKALKDAMLSHDAGTTSAVRLIIAGMKEKDVDARGRGQERASDADLLSMMQGMIKQRNESIKILRWWRFWCRPAPMLRHAILRAKACVNMPPAMKSKHC